MNINGKLKHKSVSRIAYIENYSLMKTLKIIKYYLGWSSVALLLGLGYMRIILGANNASKEGIGYLWHLFYNWGLFYVGLVIGLIIALFFIVLDVLYLKKRVENNRKSMIIRLGILLLITAVVGTVHYFLEKIIDVI